MKKILNKLFYVLQLLFLIIAFAGTLYVILQMGNRLEKSIVDNIQVFIPFVVIFILHVINLIANQKNIKDNLFYNITACLAFLTIIVVAARAVFDHNLVLANITDYKIDFTYFANFIPFLNLMLYGLAISNVLLMFHVKEKKKIKEQIEEL